MSTEIRKPTSFTEGALLLWTNESNAYDQQGTGGDETTYAYQTLDTDEFPSIWFHTFQTKGFTYTATTLYIKWQTSIQTGDDEVGVEYTKNGGGAWADLLAKGVNRSVGFSTAQIALDANQDLTQVEVRVNSDKVKGGDVCDFRISDIWTEGTYTTTAPPTTVAPTTTAPTTVGPTTLAPTTLSPTTLPPTTLAPTTLPPTTLAPTTLAPTTLPPTTLAPTSLPPTTLAPTTLEPTTLAPTTLAPTTMPFCWWDDDFTGDNGDPPNINRWTITNGTPDIQGNKLYMTVNGTKERIELRKLLTGDFSIEVLFDITTAPSTDTWTWSFRVQIDATHYAYIHAAYDSSKKFYYSANIGGGTYWGEDPRTNNWGEFRITRSGNTVSLYYKDGGGGWTLLNNDTHNIGNGAVEVGIQVDSWDNNPTVQGTFDDFTINYTCPDEWVTTVVPTTVAPTTLPPTTLPPTTLAPTSLAPTTEAPTTAPPTTTAPTTLAPTTLPPTTLAPTSLAPTTEAPTTSPPTTSAPTTAAPTSLAPTTLAPTTSLPTTVGPTTLGPTTLAPTTLPPTTDAPEMICEKVIDSTITKEFLMKSAIADQLLLESAITKEMRFHGNLC